MMTERSKSPRRRVCARIGKRLKWYDDVDATFGGRTVDTAAAVRTKAGAAVHVAGRPTDPAASGS